LIEEEVKNESTRNANTYEQELERILEKSMKEFPPLLSVKDVQSILQLGENNTYKLVKSGEFKLFQIGKHLRIAKAELILYLVKMNK
jgi:uncharacterized protein YajQ (UPF0234 family)